MKTGCSEIKILPSDSAPATSGGQGSMAYPHRDKRKLVVVNVASRCNLDCPYCFIKHRDPVDIDKSDFAYLFEVLGENIHFILGGIADYFCGYQKSERLTEFILSHDVTVHFDINGVLVHELPELPRADLDKILLLDISYHYSAMKQRGLLRQWIQNVRTLAGLIAPERYYVKMIVSLQEMNLWEEAVRVYGMTVYPYTKQPLCLQLDSYDEMFRQPELHNSAVEVLSRFEHVSPPGKFEVIDSGQREYFGERQRVCPGGSRLFKIENTGKVKVCNYTWSQGAFDLGNIKQRNFRILGGDLSCPSVRNASCFLNATEHMNIFPEYYDRT